ncbi:glycoside hydrolase [Phellopilus nigrolimitatus]|nr:glycoside hydrolase [Phellopilus nigrolimitatus]
MPFEETKREIGQHFVFGFHGYEPSDDVIKLIRDYHVGSIIIFRRNVQSIPQLYKLIQSLQQIAKDAGHSQPLLVGIDQENGLVSAFSKLDAGTQFPGAMAVGVTKDLQLAQGVANSSGREMRLAGINWVYSPVADVNSDPRNPVIGVRSFGEGMFYAQTAAALVCAVSAGLSSADLAACAKHFPGHGDTHVDSHLALPVITKDLRALEQTELVPFRAAIAHGIASIMTGHMALPPLVTALGADADPRVPASLSRGVTTRLLREKLGFEGVVVTDCLEMNAISEGYGCGPGAVMALQAGADIVMICHRIDRHLAALEATYAAVEKGELDLEALKTSGARVRAMKDRVAGRWEDVLGAPLNADKLLKLKQENARTSRRAYGLSTRWLVAPGSTLTTQVISPHADVLVLTPHMQSVNACVDDPEEMQRTADGAERNTAGPSYIAFATAVARRAPFSTHIVYSPSDATASNGLPEKLEKSILSVHTIVFTTRNAHQSSSHWQMDVLEKVVKVANEAVGDGQGKAVRVIIVASCAPYDFQLLAEEKLTKDLPCLCTYEFTKPALEEAAAKLYGETLASS